jgi:hypothetical protein
MATPWPATLPQCPILNGFSEQRQRNLAAFQPDVGPPKARRRSTAASVRTNVAFRMTNTQILAFNTFFETTLADGSLPFDWLHPVTKVNYTWMFDTGDAPVLDRMTPKTYRVTFNLLRLPA